MNALSNGRLAEIRQLLAQSQPEAAQRMGEALAKEYPHDPGLLQALGTLHAEAQDWKNASYYFRKAVALSPREPPLLFALAFALAQSGKTDSALETLIRLLTLDLNHESGLNLLYDLCWAAIQKQGIKRNPLLALLKASPQIVTLHSVAVRIYRAMGEHAERLKHLEILYNSGIRGEVFYQEYGSMLRDNGHYERSLKIGEEALAAYPNSPELRKLRAHLLLSLGHPEKALEDWKTIALMAPQDHQARLSIGIIKLLMSNGVEGYEEYGAHRDRALAQYGARLPVPEWNGEPLAGRHIFLWCSQGIGDIIMFASLMPWLLQEGARITLMLPDKLIALFARSFPAIRIVPHAEDKLAQYARGCDYHSVLGQLMRHVLPRYTPSQHTAFLLPDTARVKGLREKYVSLHPSRTVRKLVGIAWDTQNKDTFSQRNIALSEWKPLLSLPHIQFVSLQYGDHKAAIDAVARSMPGALYSDPDIDAYEDIDALAAQIAAMDEVVSIQNATAHLAGALGTPVTLLLSAASDWRWGLEATHSRWYKSVHIERQETLLRWTPVLANVRARLASGGEAGWPSNASRGL